MLYYAPRRSLADRSAAFRFLLDHNPFYILSAIFMLGGLFTLNDSLDFSPLPAGNILILIATLNLYELLLIGLAVFLYQSGLRRDAAMLLVIESFFLMDAGFLNAEIFTQDLFIGAVTNSILLGLAIVKLTVMFHALGLPITSGPFALIVLQLAVLTALPGALKAISLEHHGAVPAGVIYAAWWTVAAMLASYALLLRRVDFTRAPRIDRFGQHRVVVGAMLLVGLLSILAHLGTSNWVYDARWYTANLSPLLLALAITLGLLPNLGLRWRQRMHCHLLYPLGAIATSVAFPTALVIWPDQQEPLTPLRLVLFASAGVYLAGLVQFRQVGFALLAAGCCALAFLGASVSAMVQNIAQFNRMVLDWYQLIAPQRRINWGMVSVVLAFVLLGAGVGFSLKKRQQMEFEEA